IDTMMSPIDSIRYYASLLRAGFVAMDVHTGEIKAWVGGINHHFFQYDQVEAPRQVASLFKPIVYAAGLESGKTPCTFYPNQQKVYDNKGWKPRNADGKYGGKYSLHGALTHSVNTISVRLLQEVGYDKVREIAQNSGITVPIANDPTVALGTVETSLLEMVQVYATIANRGVHVSPQLISHIKNAKGETIYQAASTQTSQAMTAQTSQELLSMLRRVVNRGTAARLRWKYGLKTDLAGKTGTSQNQADGWFVGTSANLVAGAWVGGEFPSIHFKYMRYGQGAATALPIFATFFRQIEADPAISQKLTQPFDSRHLASSQKFTCPEFMEDLQKLEPMQMKLAQIDSLARQVPVPAMVSTAIRQ
ncbi:MAG: penicillin-binding protein, partial [Bacteroidetes bacterium]|nr:penicillin-binding protein [Bacteroidota bacterium]